MIQDEGYLLARVINALFKDRPSCAFYVSSFIIALVLGIMLLRAQSRDDLTFPVLGLACILIVVVSHAIHDIRQRRTKDFHEIEETPLELKQDIRDIEESTEELESPQWHIHDRSNQTISQPKISPEPTQSVIVPSPRGKYPNLRAKEFLQLLGIGAIFLSLGYIVAHILFANTLIALFSESSDPTTTAENTKWATGYIKNTVIQLICSIPCVTLLALVIAAFSSILFRKLLGFGFGALITTAAIVGLILGFVFYFPMQFLILIAAAF